MEFSSPNQHNIFYYINCCRYRYCDIPDDVSVIVYAFYTLKSDGTLTSLDQNSDDVNFKQLRRLKLERPHLRVLLAVGPQVKSVNFMLAFRLRNRQQFLQSHWDFFEKHSFFDGVCYDLENPSWEVEDRCSELRTQCWKQKKSLELDLRIR